MRVNLGKVEVARYVTECMRREDTPRASELALQFGISASHLSRAFRARYGVALSDYMKILQVRRAQRLLRTTELDTTRIAYACGFGTRRTFFRAYRRMTGDSPKRYRRVHAGRPFRRLPRPPRGTGSRTASDRDRRSA